MLDSPGRGEHSLLLRWGIRLCIVASLLFVLGRLFQLQVLEHRVHSQLADDNRLREITVPAPRGLIFDRNGVLLARNRPSYQLAIVPEELPDDNLDTTHIDEEYEAILEVLVALGVEEDRDAIVRMQTGLFQILGYSDFLRALDAKGAPVSLVEVPSALFEPEQTTEDPGQPTENDMSQIMRWLDAVIQARMQQTQGDVPQVPREDTVLLPDIELPLTLEGLAAVIQARVRQRQQGNASEAIPILSYQRRDSIFAVAEQGYRLPGVQVLESLEREYVYGEMVSHILGFMGPIPAEREKEYLAAGYQTPGEDVGLSGIEAWYQEELRGQPGSRIVEVDIFGHERAAVGERREAIPGQDIQLALDMNLQQVMFNTLWEMAALKEARNAAAIAMDPRNGQVLGLVSLPSFDNNVFSSGLGEGYARIFQDERRPLINYAIGGLYPPGSTFKIATALAGLEERVVSSQTVIFDHGPIFLPSRFAPNDPSQAQEFVSWNHALGFNHGALNLVKAIAVSNDIYFYMVGGGFPRRFNGLEQSQLVYWAEQLGYGQPSGIDLPGEVSFAVPDDQWKRINKASSWVTGDSYNMAIGQGYVLATPLQVLQSVMPVANRGPMYVPQLALRLVDAESGSMQEVAPRVSRTVEAQPESFHTIRLGMEDAVNAAYGTAPHGQVAGVIVAGKTGTAEYCEFDPELGDCLRDEEGELPTHASYLAFAPARNPEISVIVFIYGGGEGSDAAVPVATQILEAYFSLKTEF